MNQKLMSIFCIIAVIQSAFCLVQKDSRLQQLHRLYSDDRYYYQRSGSGVGWFSAVIISVIAGVLCFLGIMYYFKWRRQGTVNLPFFGNRNLNQPYPNPNYNPPGAYPQTQPTFGGNPYGTHDQHQHAYNPNYPQYPTI